MTKIEQEFAELFGRKHETGMAVKTKGGSYWSCKWCGADMDLIQYEFCPITIVDDRNAEGYWKSLGMVMDVFRGLSEQIMPDVMDRRIVEIRGNKPSCLDPIEWTLLQAKPSQIAEICIRAKG